MTSVAIRMPVHSRWGVVFRCTVAVVLSFADLISDIVMIVIYFRQGKNFYAYATIACCLTSLVLQAFFVILQNRKSKRLLVRDMLILLTFTKPAWNTYLVCIGRERSPEQVFSPLTEMVASKGCELLGESIPGSVIQTYAVLTQTSIRNTRAALLSLSLSYAATAYISSTLIYDLDLDTHRRRNQPGMYGLLRKYNFDGPPNRRLFSKVKFRLLFVPPPLSFSPADRQLSRTTAFAAMIGMSAAQIASRSAGFAMVAAVSGPLMAAIFFVEFGLFLLYKMARRDLTYVFSLESKCLGLAITLYLRFLRFIMAGMVGFLQER